jgi:regulator of replication initiation timing
MSEKQTTTVAELREKNEIVINRHIAALNAAGAALTQFLDVLTANAVLTAENEKLKAQLAALQPKAVEAEAVAQA